MTKRCALYIWVPWKFSGVPNYAHGYFSRSFDGLLFRSILWICPQKLKFVALPVPEIIRSTQKNWGSPWIRPRSLFSKIFNGCRFGWTVWMFRPNLKFVALPVPEIIGEQKYVTLHRDWIHHYRVREYGLYAGDCQCEWRYEELATYSDLVADCSRSRHWRTDVFREQTHDKPAKTDMKQCTHWQRDFH